MPPCYSDPHQLHPHHAPAQPGPTNHPSHIAHITAPHHHVFHHHQPLPPHPPTPGYHTQPAHPQHHHHAVQHQPPPPLHRPTTHEPRYTPMDPRGAAHAHQQHQGLVGAPHHHQQPPHQHPIPASTIHLRRLKLHGQNHTKCTQFGPCKKIVFHRLCFLKTEYDSKESIFLTICAISCLFSDSRKQKKTIKRINKCYDFSRK